MLLTIAACLGLAALSLLLPSEPSYDPWAWFVWAREITHLELDTLGGPSWKPLPVALVAVAAPFGDELPVGLWVVVARTGALLALVLAFRLAARLTGGSWALRAVAGAIAVAALASTPDWFQFTAHASEAPLAVSLMLWAILRHLDGARGQVMVLGTLACLMRPELFLFVALYAVWLWRAEPDRRLLVAALMVVIPLAWLVPDWIGSGNPLDGGSQARSEPKWSLSHAERPWLRALDRVHNHAGLALELMAVVAIAAAVARRQRAVLALALAAAAAAGLYVAMTQTGFSGNPRYVLPALVILSVLAGVGAARTAEVGGAVAVHAAAVLSGLRRPFAARAPGRASAAARLAGATLCLMSVALLARPLVDDRQGRLEFEVREVGRRMDLQQGLERVVRVAGGAEALRALGSVTTNRSLHTRLAWELGYPIQDVERGYGHHGIVRTYEKGLAGRVLVWGTPRLRQLVARAGSFVAYQRIDVSYRLVTAPLQVFNIRREVVGKPVAG